MDYKTACMKGLMVLVVCLLLMRPGYGQGSSVMNQKETMIENQLIQIAGLQIYLELAQKGYGIYKDGLDLITDIKDGEFSLHKDYFASLSSVKGGIKNSGAVEDIIEWRRNIQRMSEGLQRKDLAGDRAAVRKALDHLEGLADDAVHQLDLLTTNGHYQLSDEERIAQIAQVHREMYGYYAFGKAFTGQVIATMVGRQKEGNDVRVLRSLEGLK
jgi:hypothetical protein